MFRGGPYCSADRKKIMSQFDLSESTNSLPICPSFWKSFLHVYLWLYFCPNLDFIASICVNHILLISQILKQLFKIFIIHSFIFLEEGRCHSPWRSEGNCRSWFSSHHTRSQALTQIRQETPLPMSALFGPLGKLPSWPSTFYILRRSTSLMWVFFFTKPVLTFQCPEHVQVCFPSSTAVFLITETACYFLVLRGLANLPRLLQVSHN